MVFLLQSLVGDTFNHLYHKQRKHELDKWCRCRQLCSQPGKDWQAATVTRH